MLALTAAAARAGVPQVIVPQAADQPYWAEPVAALGIGAAHDGPTSSVTSLSDSLVDALGSSTSSRAGDVSRSIRTDGAAVACGVLADAIAQ